MYCRTFYFRKELFCTNIKSNLMFFDKQANAENSMTFEKILNGFNIRDKVLAPKLLQLGHTM